MKLISSLALAATLAGSAAAYGNSGSAARALVSEYGLMTVNVSRVETDVYEVAYRSDLLVTSGCWVSAYAEPAVVTQRLIIFVDANEVCSIVSTRQRGED